MREPTGGGGGGGGGGAADIDSPAAGARLERLFGEQVGLCERLWSLRGRASLCVSAERCVLGVLAERQVLVDAIVELSSQLEPFRRSWIACVGLDAERRERVRVLTERIDELLGLIDARDRADSELLSQRRASATDGLTTVRQGGGVVCVFERFWCFCTRYQDRQA